MQAVMNGYQGFSLVLRLNSDRLFCFGTLVVGLLAGAFLGNVLIEAFPVMQNPAAF
jgi:hypothetical protein